MKDYATHTGNTFFLSALESIEELFTFKRNRWHRPERQMKKDHIIGSLVSQTKDKLPSGGVSLDKIPFRPFEGFLSAAKRLHARYDHLVPEEKVLEENKGYYPSLPFGLFPETYHIGQLALKNEPAGKVRVFAMVDAWTQNLFEPLHLLLFKFLRSLPNDGTFNQDASFKRCQDKSKLYSCSYGYDLSAATDRLPIDLQISILSKVFLLLGLPEEASYS